MYRQQHRADGNRDKQCHDNMEFGCADGDSGRYLHRNRYDCERLYRDEFHCDNPRCDLTNGEYYRTDNGINL